MGLHYRKLTVWQKAMELAVEMYRLAKFLPREETYGMRSQITRATVSIPSNIAEGWTRESDREKLQFLSIAQGSLAEMETQLTLCEQIGWFKSEQTMTLRNLVDEVGKMLSSLRRQLRNNRKNSELQSPESGPVKF